MFTVLVTLQVRVNDAQLEVDGICVTCYGLSHHTRLECCHGHTRKMN